MLCESDLDNKSRKGKGKEGKEGKKPEQEAKSFILFPPFIATFLQLFIVVMSSQSFSQFVS